MTDLTTFLAGTTLPELLESRGLEDPVAFITRFESAFLTMLGFPQMEVITANFHKWPEDKLNADSATLDDATLSAVATTINVTAGQGVRFRAGDIVQFDGSRELISVTSVATDALTVVRAIRSTTGETQVQNDLLQVMNNPNTEAGTAKVARPTELEQNSNFTEMFDETASVSRKMRKTMNIGNVGDQLDHQVLRAQQDLIRRIAKTVINGRRQDTNPEGTASVASTMDGIVQFILTGADSVVVDALGGALTEDLLNQAMEDSWSSGGSPTLIAIGPRQRRAISKLMEGRVRFSVDETTLGVVVERFVSPVGGVVDVMEADKHMPKDIVLILDRSRLSLKKLGADGDPFEIEDLSKTGHVDNKLVSIELTLEAKNTDDGGHALIQNLSAA
ncbi:hypothetical protein LCGC14_0995630 [marine sediment metagenome]|uniref:Uncharacterized protein n=1 Tax=marine sediment metagenome TaxID=412755 RepID=A0A0F9NQZ0_9ZZZZ